MMKYFSFLLTLIVVSCSTHQKDTLDEQSGYPIVKSSKEFDAKTHCDTVIIEGKLKEYEPEYTGKGGGTQYFDYEIQLKNSPSLPIHNANVIESQYINKKVSIFGILECGAIDPEGIQNINIRRLQKVIEIEVLE